MGAHIPGLLESNVKNQWSPNNNLEPRVPGSGSRVQSSTSWHASSIMRFGFEMENFMRLQQSPRNARTVRLDVEPLHRSKQEWHCDFWAGKIGGREGE